MSGWHNETGRPLASDAWLEAHHQAKLPERKAFVELIKKRIPTCVVDLGCGPGLWLELLANTLSPNCELVGIDSDEASLDAARMRARNWDQASRFEALNFESQSNELPEADVFLAFNVFSYVKNPAELLATIKSKLRPGGCLIVRQYDGALLRMGPMSDKDRQLIDTSLMSSIVGSGQFKHYDLDRVFSSIVLSGFENKAIDFEVFRRVAPYPPEFQNYFLNTVEWTRKHISDTAKDRLDAWVKTLGNGVGGMSPAYFMEVDLVAWLS